MPSSTNFGRKVRPKVSLLVFKHYDDVSSEWSTNLPVETSGPLLQLVQRQLLRRVGLVGQPLIILRRQRRHVPRPHHRCLWWRYRHRQRSHVMGRVWTISDSEENIAIRESCITSGPSLPLNKTYSLEGWEQCIFGQWVIHPFSFFTEGGQLIRRYRL